MGAVVHHGGAGTTAAGLRAGKPTLIIPHMADQPFWGRRVHELGAGVKPLPRHQLTTETFTAALRKLVTDRSIEAKAGELGQLIREERGLENGLNWINDFARHHVAQGVRQKA
jgi:sterol 3beta-glucosyltransferase